MYRLFLVFSISPKFFLKSLMPANAYGLYKVWYKMTPDMFNVLVYHISSQKGLQFSDSSCPERVGNSCKWSSRLYFSCAKLSLLSSGKSELVG